jgi:hypothetical protein
MTAFPERKSVMTYLRMEALKNAGENSVRFPGLSSAEPPKGCLETVRTPRHREVTLPQQHIGYKSSQHDTWTEEEDSNTSLGSLVSQPAPSLASRGGQLSCSIQPTHMVALGCVLRGGNGSQCAVVTSSDGNKLPKQGLRNTCLAF